MDLREELYLMGVVLMVASQGDMRMSDIEAKYGNKASFTYTEVLSFDNIQDIKNEVSSIYKYGSNVFTKVFMFINDMDDKDYELLACNVDL